MPFSDFIKAELADHLERLDSDDDQAHVFTSPTSEIPLRTALSGTQRARTATLTFTDM